MSDPFNQAPNPNSPAQGKQEQLASRLEIVEKPTPEALKAIRELRILASEDEWDAYMLVTTPDKEKGKSDHELEMEMFGFDGFVVLAWSGSEPVALIRASKYKEQKDEGWYIGSAYVKKQQETNHRRQGLGKKIMATTLNRVRKLGGIKAVGGVKKNNTESLGLTDSFFFKTTGETAPKLGWIREVDLTDPRVIKKIEEVLNEG